jgi:hypothetical protein
LNEFTAEDDGATMTGEHGSENRYVVLGIFAVFAFSAININQYLYGIDNQTITIPFLKAFLNQQLYPNDILLTQRQYFYTYFWNALGVVIKVSGISIPHLILGLHFLATITTMAAAYYLGKLLFRKPEAALLTLFFFLFTKRILGGETTVLGVFDTAVVARPMVLFAFYTFLKQRYYLTAFLLGSSFLVHPLSAAYGMGIVSLNSLVRRRQMGWRTLFGSHLLLALLMSPSLIWKLRISPESLHLFLVDPCWLELLRLRSTHHLFPFSWETDVYIQTLLLFGGFVYAWRWRPFAEAQQFVRYAMIARLGFWLTGTLFSEWRPLAIVLQFQLFRSSYFFFSLVAICVAHAMYRQMEESGSLLSSMIALLLAVAVLYHMRAWWHASIAMGLFITGAGVYRWRYRRVLPRRMFFVLLTLLVGIMGIGAFLQRDGITITNAQERNWLAVQQWARTESELQDVFVVPPLWQNEGFRVAAERPIYVDWKDGTQMLFNPAYGYEWYRRMRSLGFAPGNAFEPQMKAIKEHLERGYRSLDEASFLRIAREMGDQERIVYLVMFKDRPLNFPLRYENERYLVYQVE